MEFSLSHSIICVVVVQLLSHVWFSATPGTVACQGSLSFTISQSLLKVMSIEWWCHSNIVLCHPLLLLLQYFPASGSFLMSQLFILGGQSIGVSASASVFPVNSQDWFPLGLTDFISLQSKGLSRVFSSTTFRKYQFFSAQPSLCCNSHNLYMTTGKTITLTIQTFVSNVSAF